MIYGEIEHFRGRFCTSQAVKTALDFLVDRIPSLEDGKHDVEDGIFVQVKRYSPAPAAARRYESHIKYVDIQVVYEGSEIIYYQPLLDSMTKAVVEDRLATNDVRFHAEPPAGPEIPIKLRPGLFVLLMPEDAHKTECIGDSATARKAIAKIPVELMKF